MNDCGAGKRPSVPTRSAAQCKGRRRDGVQLQQSVPLGVSSLTHFDEVDGPFSKRHRAPVTGGP